MVIGKSTDMMLHLTVCIVSFLNPGEFCRSFVIPGITDRTIIVSRVKDSTLSIGKRTPQSAARDNIFKTIRI